MEVGFELKEKVAALEAALLSKHPTMPTLLGKIHSLLLQYPEQVVLLTDEERASIVSGLQSHTKTHFAESIVKAAKSTSASKNLKDRIKSLGKDAF